MTICSVLGGIIAEKIGRKKTILFISPLLAIGLIIQGLASESHVLNVGRFISGVAGGLAFGPAAVNVSQISEMKSYFQKYKNENIYNSMISMDESNYMLSL